MDALVTALMAPCLDATWRDAGLGSMAFTELNRRIFLDLLRPDLQFVVTVTMPEYTVAVSLHRSAHIAPVVLSDTPAYAGLIHAIIDLVADDVEAEAVEHDASDTSPLHPAYRRITITLGESVRAAVAAAYRPRQWALSFLARTFSDPAGWDNASYRYAYNTLWHVTHGVDEVADIHAAIAAIPKAHVAEDAWRRLFGRMTV